MKSKHFRKDVIIARVIAGVLLIILIALIIFAISLFKDPSGSDKNSQSSQNTQNSQEVTPGTQDTEETQGTENSESTEDVQDTQATENTQTPSDSETESQAPEKKYVKTTTQVRLRKEPNTNCATLDRIDGGTVLLVEETLDGWYKVTHNGQTGYVSADYAKVVEQ